MKVKLKNTFKKYGDHSYTLLLTPRENEILISTEDGDEIASINVDTMVDSNDSPTGFFVSFQPKEKNSSQDNVAHVYSQYLKSGDPSISAFYRREMRVI